MTIQLIRSLLLAAAAATGACASMDHQRNSKPDPDTRLNHMLKLDQEAYDSGRMCREIWHDQGRLVDCQAIQREIDRLYVEYPTHERILLANAVMHFEFGQAQSAQWLLDQLLQRSGSFPAAVVLRSQLAMRDGNLTLARRMLDEHIPRAPDHAALHETLASVHFLEGRYADAARSLQRAAMLGAPDWRIFYHRGLLHEMQQRFEQACQAYDNSIAYKPHQRASLARMIGLSHQPACASRLQARQKKATAPS